jgi:hypothetical protein
MRLMRRRKKHFWPPCVHWIRSAAIQTWSPNEKYVIISITNQENAQADLYLFDIEKMLENPSTEPLRLTMDEAMKYEAIGQPEP